MTLLWRKLTFFFSQQVWIENSFLVRVPLHVYVSFLFWGFCLFLTFCTMSQSFFLCSYMHQPPSVWKTLFPWSHLQSYRLSSSNHHNMEWIWVIFVCSFLYVIKFWIWLKLSCQSTFLLETKHCELWPLLFPQWIPLKYFIWKKIHSVLLCIMHRLQRKASSEIRDKSFL